MHVLIYLSGGHLARHDAGGARGGQALFKAVCRLQGGLDS